MLSSPKADVNTKFKLCDCDMIYEYIYAKTFWLDFQIHRPPGTKTEYVIK